MSEAGAEALAAANVEIGIHRARMTSRSFAIAVAERLITG